MSFAGKTSERSASLLATARYHRGSASGITSGCFSRIIDLSRLAIILQIPVGYQDETGFDCGIVSAKENHAGDRYGDKQE